MSHLSGFYGIRRHRMNFSSGTLKFIHYVQKIRPMFILRLKYIYIKMDKTSWTYGNKMVANIFSKNVNNELMRKKRDGHFETNEN